MHVYIYNYMYRVNMANDNFDRSSTLCNLLFGPYVCIYIYIYIYIYISIYIMMGS